MIKPHYTLFTKLNKKRYQYFFVKNYYRIVFNNFNVFNIQKLMSKKYFEILLGNSFLGLKYPDLLKKMYDARGLSGGCSFWIRKK